MLTFDSIDQGTTLSQHCLNQVADQVNGLVFIGYNYGCVRGERVWVVATAIVDLNISRTSTKQLVNRM